MAMPPDDQALYDLVRPVTALLHDHDGAAAIVIARDTFTFAKLSARARHKAGSGPIIVIDKAELVCGNVALLCGHMSEAHVAALNYTAGGDPFIVGIYRGRNGAGDLRRCVRVECTCVKHAKGAS